MKRWRMGKESRKDRKLGSTTRTKRRKWKDKK